jgi:hypothetical protein
MMDDGREYKMIKSREQHWRKTEKEGSHRCLVSSSKAFTLGLGTWLRWPWVQSPVPQKKKKGEKKKKKKEKLLLSPNTLQRILCPLHIFSWSFHTLLFLTSTNLLIF